MYRETPTLNPRLEYIDLARVVGAFLICVFHYHVFTGLSGLISYIFLIGRVPFFFVLAGFFTHINSWQSYKKRVLILLIPLFLWELIRAIIYNNLVISDGFETWDGYLLNYKNLICYSPTNLSLWFLKSLLLCTILSPLLMLCKKYLVFIGIVALAVSNLNLIPRDIPSFATLTQIVDGLGYFCFGLALKKLSTEKISAFFERYSICLLITSMVLSALCIVAELHAGHVITFPAYLPLLGILAITATGWLINKHLPTLKKIMLPMASATYLVFLMHYPLILVINKYTDPAYFIHLSIPVSLAIMAFAYAIVSLLRKVAPCLLPFVAGIRK